MQHMNLQLSGLSELSAVSYELVGAVVPRNAHTPPAPDYLSKILINYLI